MTQVERRLVAILAADVVGYSRMAEADEQRTLAALNDLLRRTFEPVMREHHGRIVKLMGDGVLVAFDSVVDAVAAAARVQRATAAAQSGKAEDSRLVLRIGVNLGDAVVEGDDLMGDAVNIAARLQQIAEPGGVLVSGTAFDHLTGKLDDPLSFLGERRLKNVSRPIRVYRLGNAPARPMARIGAAVGGRPAVFATLALLLVALLTLMVQVFRWSPADVAERPSIAILPFDDFTGDADSKRLALGLTEDIITDLARFREFDVMARNATEKYGGQPVDPRDVAEDLGIRYLLEGSIQRAEDRLRITAQLIDAESGAHLWSERWDRPAGDLFAIQTGIAEQVAGRLGGGGVIAKAEQERVRRQRPSDLDAYELYLQAQGLAAEATADANAAALEVLEQAIELDPQLARAWVLLAWQHDLSKRYGAPAESATREALAAAQRAVALDPMDAEAHAALAVMLADQGQLERAKAEFEAALRLNPGHIETLTFYSGWASAFGDAEAGAEAADRALRLDPDYAPWAPSLFRWAYFMAGRYADALWISERQPPENRSRYGKTLHAAILGALDRKSEAAAAVFDLLADDPDLTVEGFVSDPLLTAKDRQRLTENLIRAGLPLCAPPDLRSRIDDAFRLPECDVVEETG